MSRTRQKNQNSLEQPAVIGSGLFSSNRANSPILSGQFLPTYRSVTTDTKVIIVQICITVILIAARPPNIFPLSRV